MTALHFIFWFGYAHGVADDDLPGVDFGDLAASLDAIVREQEHDGAEADRQLPLEQIHSGFCAHNRAYINASMRQLVCKECAASLDPFDFLVKLSRDLERWTSGRREAERRCKDAHKRLQELLRLERNTRNRLKRLKRNDAPDDKPTGGPRRA